MGVVCTTYGCGLYNIWVWFVQCMDVVCTTYGCGLYNVWVWSVQRMGVVCAMSICDLYNILEVHKCKVQHIMGVVWVHVVVGLHSSSTAVAMKA